MNRLAVAMSVIASAISAQSSLVSPAANATKEGNAGNNYPFYSTFRYMQIHTDLKGQARAIKGMSFRRDGLAEVTSQAVQRKLTIEVWVGEGDLGKRSATFASNYIGAPQAVVARKTIVTPSWVAKPPMSPAPFDFSIVFDRPAVYTGKNDLVWEIAIWSSDQDRKQFVADSVSSGKIGLGSSRTLGVGCTVTGQTNPMFTAAFVDTHRLPDRGRYFSSTRNAVANAPVITLVGATNPSLPLPLCGPGLLYTDGTVVLAGKADASGLYTTGSSLYFPWDPAAQGRKLYTQALTVDPNQPVLPIALSNGVESTIPGLGELPLPIARITAEGMPGAMTGAVGIGWAVVTRFDL